MSKEEKKISFKDTLNLPRTEFPIRENFKENDAKLLNRWSKEDLFGASFSKNIGAEKFILHDGPPYANGNIHLGHAYNKILKDIICKVQRMFGKHVPVTPGWDCHGLPIEFKVTEEFPNLSRENLKKKCREYAKKWIDIQREEFKSLGVLMDWDNPYLTMNFNYESSIIRAFGEFVDGGYIERKKKTVPWCATCKTVLASAEIEYEERKDPSIYVKFPLEATFKKKLFPNIESNEISLLIWTTTPWTLPLNRAVVIKPDSEYVLLKVNKNFVILGKALVDKFCSEMKINKNVVLEFSSKKLSGSKVQHPFVKNLVIPILFDAFVSLSEGTACVHSAPGCGPEDYEIALKNDLEIFSPLSIDGKYTEGIKPKELENMTISEGQIWVLKKLAESEKLIFKSSIRHQYPHCWRCHSGLIFRATKQWFCNLSKDNLKKNALLACETIQAIPKKSINRLKATVEGRLEWCLSRQRVWGVPIPALLCNKCDTPFIDKTFVNKVAIQVEQYGIEYWDLVEIKNLADENLACKNCGNDSFKKETDILDVWFDSGVSHYAVLKKRKDLGLPADMYLEGKDQHRGWFQSSLLTCLVLEGFAPMKILATHGFSVDKKGRKMSKSLGNVVAPQDLIGKLGTDGLRLWASSIDMQSDAIVSDLLIKNVQQVLKKVRNTCRFLLSNLYDFDNEKDCLPLEKLLPIDLHALLQLCHLNNDILKLYENHNLTAVFHRLADYCSTSLSSFYLDIVKDRLYVEQSNGEKRRSTQTVCWKILDTLTRLIAPILSFAAEQISDHYQKNKKESIHLQNFVDLQNIFNSLLKLYSKSYSSDFISSHLPIPSGLSSSGEMRLIELQQEHVWHILKAIRSAILKEIELKREKEILKHSLEASVVVFFDMEKEELKPLSVFYKQIESSSQEINQFFKEFLIVSQFEIASSSEGLKGGEIDGLYTLIKKAEGDKCPRCWNWSITKDVNKLCDRCQKILV